MVNETILSDWTNVLNMTTRIEKLPFYEWRYCFISNGEVIACTPEYWVIGLGLLVVGVGIFTLIKSRTKKECKNK